MGPRVHGVKCPERNRLDLVGTGSEGPCARGVQRASWYPVGTGVWYPMRTGCPESLFSSRDPRSHLPHLLLAPIHGLGVPSSLPHGDLHCT